MDGQVLTCEVLSQLMARDPDYDIVSYRYEWRVNNRVVRSVTSAALTDLRRRHREAQRQGELPGHPVGRQVQGANGGGGQVGRRALRNPKDCKDNKDSKDNKIPSLAHPVSLRSLLSL